MQSTAWVSQEQAREPGGECEPLIRQNKIKLGFGTLYGSEPAMLPVPAVIYDTSSNTKHLGRENGEVPSRKCMQQDGRGRQHMKNAKIFYKSFFTLKKQAKK